MAGEKARQVARSVGLFALGFYLLLDGFALIEGFAFANPLKAVVLGSFVLVLLVASPPRTPSDLALFVAGTLVLIAVQGLAHVPFSADPPDAAARVFAFLVKGPIVFLLFYHATRHGTIGLDRAVGLWTGLALVFAAHAIVAFLVIGLLGWPPPTWEVVMPRFEPDWGQKVTPFGLNNTPPRVQSFFIEATKLGHFLVLPLFHVLGSWEGRRRVVGGTVLGLAILFTFNTVVLLGVAGGLLLWRVLLLPARTRLVAGLLLLAVFAGASYAVVEGDVLDYQGENRLLNALAYRSQSVEDKRSQVERAFALANEHPLGVGMGTREREQYTGGANTASALLQILLEGGWLGLLLYGAIGAAVFGRVLRSADEVRQGRVPPRVLAFGVGFLTLAAVGFTYGPYTDNVFVLGLAFLLVTWELHAPAPPRA